MGHITTSFGMLSRLTVLLVRPMLRRVAESQLLKSPVLYCIYNSIHTAMLSRGVFRA